MGVPECAQFRAFCVFRHWLLRKAYLSLQTILTVFAGRPTKMRPLFNCSDFEELYPHVTEAHGALGYACRGEGWWLSESCRAKSPGDEYLENCIPASQHGLWPISIFQRQCLAVSHGLGVCVLVGRHRGLSVRLGCGPLTARSGGSQMPPFF